MATTASTLIQQAYKARREDRPADAHRDFAEAVALCRQSAMQAELIKALKGLGQIERDLGNGEAALPLYEEAVDICRQQDDDLLLAHTVRHLGDIHQDAGRAELAEPCYQEALALYRSSGRTEPLDLANALRPLAILKESAGQIEEAIALWSEARQLYAAANVGEGVAGSSAHLVRLNRLSIAGGDSSRAITDAT